MKKFKDFMYESKVNIKALKKNMTVEKVKHSKRVAELTKIISTSTYIYNAALYHDFLERGGSIEELKKIINQKSIKLVEILTHYEDDITVSTNKSLDTLKSRFKNLDSKIKNDIIIIKICDRIDNLMKKKRISKLNNIYLLKSKELFNFLLESYEGDNKFLINFIKNYFPEILEKN